MPSQEIYCKTFQLPLTKMHSLYHPQKSQQHLCFIVPFLHKNLSARDDSSASRQQLAPERIIFRLERSKCSTLSLNGKKKNEIIKILLKLPLISFEKSIKTFLDFHFKGFGFSFPNTLNCFSRFLNLAHSFWNLKVLQGLGKWTSCLKNCLTRKFTLLYF